MKRDMDTVRRILEYVEAADGDHWIAIPHMAEEGPIEGISVAEVRYHVELMVEQGLIAGDANAGCIVINRLTWSGHDFLDTFRNDEIWSRTKAKAKEIGGLPFQIFLDLGKEYLKAEIKRHLGL